jgi:hypothetical protein
MMTKTDELSSGKAGSLNAGEEIVVLKTGRVDGHSRGQVGVGEWISIVERAGFHNAREYVRPIPKKVAAFEEEEDNGQKEGRSLGDKAKRVIGAGVCIACTVLVVYQLAMRVSIDAYCSTTRREQGECE